MKRQILMAVVEMFFLDKEVWLSPTKMGWLAERRARISFGCTIRQGGKGSPHGPVGLMSRRKRVSPDEESFWPITKEIFSLRYHIILINVVVTKSLGKMNVCKKIKSCRPNWCWNTLCGILYNVCSIMIYYVRALVVVDSRKVEEGCEFHIQVE